MKGSKKLLAILVAAAMLLSLVLAGCGENKTGTTEETKATASVAQTAQAQDKPEQLSEAKLTWYFGGGWPQADQDLVFGEVNKYLKDKINATVDFKPVSWGDYEQKIKVIITAGEDYDLCFTAPWINNYAQNVGKGAFLPLDDLLPKYAPKRWADLSEYWDAARVNGKIYGFINEQIFARTACISVEKALSDKYNFSATYKVGDLSSLEPFISAVYKDSPDKFVSISFNDIPETFNMEYISGATAPGAVTLDDPNFKVFNYFESESFIKYVNLMREWNKKGYLHSNETLAKKRDSTGPDWKNHKILLEVAGAYKPGVDAEMTAGYGFATSAYPAGIPVLTTSAVIGTMFGISRNSKNPERALMMLDLVNTDAKLYNLISFGIEGTHYTMENGFMVKEGDAANRYYPAVPWMFGNQFLANVTKGMPADVWEQTKALNKSAKKSVLFGFTFDPEPVKSEIAKCSAVIDEYRTSINLGLLDDSKYKEFLDKLKNAGSDTIITEMQKQIDAWKAAKG